MSKLQGVVTLAFVDLFACGLGATLLLWLLLMATAVDVKPMPGSAAVLDIKWKLSQHPKLGIIGIAEGKIFEPSSQNSRTSSGLVNVKQTDGGVVAILSGRFAEDDLLYVFVEDRLQCEELKWNATVTLSGSRSEPPGTIQMSATALCFCVPLRSICDTRPEMRLVWTRP